jgi:methyl-accepting chemotaxis protein
MVHRWRGGHDRDTAMSEGSARGKQVSEGSKRAREASKRGKQASEGSKRAREASERGKQASEGSKRAREALQSASAGHAKEVSRLLQQLREASEVREIHEGGG